MPGRAVLVLFMQVFSATVTTAQEIKTVQDVLNANIRATGGEEKWRSVRTIQIKETSGSTSPSVSKQVLEQTKKIPGFGYFVSTAESPRRKRVKTELFTPETSSGSEKINDGAATIIPVEKRCLLTASEELNMLTDSRYVFEKLSAEKLDDGRECWVIEGKFDGTQVFKKYYDKATFLLSASSEKVNMGGTMRVLITAHKEYDGLLFPAEQKIFFASMGIEIVITLESVIINEKLEDSFFTSKL